MLKKILSTGILMVSTGYLMAQEWPIKPTQGGHLPGELSAEEILNGKYPWPASPEVSTKQVGSSKGFDPDAFGTAPEPGVHPRILFSPTDLPEMRRRLKVTKVGQARYAELKNNVLEAKLAGTRFANVYAKLIAGDVEGAEKLLGDYKNAGADIGTQYHHRPEFSYLMMLSSFQALIDDDNKLAKEMCAAVTTLAQVYQNRMDELDRKFKEGLRTMATKDGYYPRHMLNSDVWRSNRREAIGGEPYFAFTYDYLHPYMNEAQRAVSRKAINTYIGGKVTMGSHMPSHFRNWNWIAVGAGLQLFSVATEGEEGHDPRVYEHMKKVQTDYVKYGWSDRGSSREAIGYTQFGLRWSGPAMAAMARRGHNMWGWERWYNQMEWYAHSVQPGGARFISHGDGGNGSTGFINPMMFKKAYPNNPVVDYVYQQQIAATKGSDYPQFVMYMCIYAVDPMDQDHGQGAKLGLEKTFWDEERKSMITRNTFGPHEVQFQFECRDDAIAPNHQHADRGNFTFASHGRVWARDMFRGVESRHHNVVTIDYAGQGYVTPPGKWLSFYDDEMATFGVCDAKYAYDWSWDGVLDGFHDKSIPRRYFERWKNFARDFRNGTREVPENWQAQIDRSPVVEKYYKGFEFGDPRMWDEYRRPVRIPHNPVQRAFRTAGLVRGKHSYALIVDDIQKDLRERTYSWTMMTDDDLQAISIKTDEIILGPKTESKPGLFGINVPQPEAGTPQLLIKVLHRSIPKSMFNNPQINFETVEYKDARKWPNGRSFGLVKRLVVPSYSVAPDFKILLYPHRAGEALPTFEWNEAQDQVSVSWEDQQDLIQFNRDQDRRTKVKIERDGKTLLATE